MLLTFLFSEKRFRCPDCTRSYKYRKGLSQHMKYECGKEPQFHCPFLTCQYRARVKGNLTNHIKAVHKCFNNDLYSYSNNYHDDYDESCFQIEIS